MLHSAISLISACGQRVTEELAARLHLGGKIRVPISFEEIVMTQSSIENNYQEGLGLVYERFVLNKYLESLLGKYPIQSVLEVPAYGIAGITGINSFALVKRGCSVTIVDNDTGRCEGIRKLWQDLSCPALVSFQSNFDKLPFDNASFDLVWNFCALPYVPDMARLLSEMMRLSRKYILIVVPNTLQPFYWVRKFLLDRPAFENFAEQNVCPSKIKARLKAEGARLIEEGVIDVPPWPDTCMPASALLEKLHIRSKRAKAYFSTSRWNWHTVEIYKNNYEFLEAELKQYTFLERLPIPWRLKLIWAHHRYFLAEKSGCI